MMLPNSPSTMEEEYLSTLLHKGCNLKEASSNLDPVSSKHLQRRGFRKNLSGHPLLMRFGSRHYRVLSNHIDALFDTIHNRTSLSRNHLCSLKGHLLKCTHVRMTHTLDLLAQIILDLFHSNPELITHCFHLGLGSNLMLAAPARPP